MRYQTFCFCPFSFVICSYSFHYYMFPFVFLFPNCYVATFQRLYVVIDVLFRKHFAAGNIYPSRGHFPAALNFFIDQIPQSLFLEGGGGSLIIFPQEFNFSARALIPCQIQHLLFSRLYLRVRVQKHLCHFLSTTFRF